MKALPFIPVPETCEVALHYEQNGQAVRTILHFKRAGGGPYDGDALDALGDVINAQWVAQLRSAFNVGIVYFGCTLKALDAADSPGVEKFLAESIDGVLGAPVWPDNVAFALKKATALTGRSFRGRIFHFGSVIGALSDPGHVLPATAEGLVGAYNDFFSHVADGATNSILQVVSKYHGVANVIVDGRYKRKPIPRDVGITTPVLAITFADLALDSQRRRLPGRGA